MVSFAITPFGTTTTFPALVSSLVAIGQVPPTDANNLIASVLGGGNHPPAIVCPPATTNECTQSNGTPASLTAQVSDADGDALTVNWLADGSQVQVDNVPGSTPPTSAAVTLNRPFTLGSHTLDVTVTDNRSTPVACHTTVSIRDTTAPVITASLGQQDLWPPDHQMINVGFNVSAQDQCSGSQPISVKVFSNESQNATGDGNFAPDATGTSGTLLLRGERSGSGNGRVYLVVVKSTDPAGNSSFACSTAVVAHDDTVDSSQAVHAQADAARAFCSTHGGAAPAGYFAVATNGAP